MEFEERMWKYEIPKMWIEHKLKNISESEPVQIKTFIQVSDNRADIEDVTFLFLTALLNHESHPCSQI